MENMFWTGYPRSRPGRPLVQKDKSKNPKRMTLKEAVEKFVKEGDNVGIRLCERAPAGGYSA